MRSRPSCQVPQENRDRRGVTRYLESPDSRQENYHFLQKVVERFPVPGWGICQSSHHLEGLRAGNCRHRRRSFGVC